MADIENFIDAMINKDHVQSNNMFAELIGQKVDAALDAEKVAVASQIFNGAEDLEDEDVSDEDLEMAADDIVDDEEFTEYEFGHDAEEEVTAETDEELEELEDETV